MWHFNDDKLSQVLSVKPKDIISNIFTQNNTIRLLSLYTKHNVHYSGVYRRVVFRDESEYI